MDRVEAELCLPDNADPIESYAAYYGFANGEVMAIFVQPKEFEDALNPNCSAEDEATGELSSCFGPSNEGAPVLQAGERYWLKDIEANFPPLGVFDCTSFTVIFDPAENRITYAECHSDQDFHG